MAGSAAADAVMEGDAARLQTLLEAHKDVNAPQADGSTALHWAAYHGDARTAETLLAAGAHPNVAMDTGMTPLALACQADNAELVTNQTLANGETALMMAARTGSVTDPCKWRAKNRFGRVFESQCRVPRRSIGPAARAKATAPKRA